MADGQIGELGIEFAATVLGEEREMLDTVGPGLDGTPYRLPAQRVGRRRRSPLVSDVYRRGDHPWPNVAWCDTVPTVPPPLPTTLTPSAPASRFSVALTPPRQRSPRGCRSGACDSEER